MVIESEDLWPQADRFVLFYYHSYLTFGILLTIYSGVFVTDKEMKNTRYLKAGKKATGFSPENAPERI